MTVEEMVWGMWHAWEIKLYFVWWENLKERDYLGNLCVYRKVILKWERASCVYWLRHSCPGYEHGRPPFCRLSCGHPVHCHLLYQASKSPMMSCTNQYQHCNVLSILCVCMCRCACAQLCFLK